MTPAPRPPAQPRQSECGAANASPSSA
jgi:hypothetical protein